MTWDAQGTVLSRVSEDTETLFGSQLCSALTPRCKETSDLVSSQGGSHPQGEGGGSSNLVEM